MTTNLSAKRTYNSPEDIETAVKRNLEKGESVAVLAKYYKVSQPAVYKWIEKYKRDRSESIRMSENRMNVSPAALAASSRVDTEILVEQLRAENRKLRDKLMDMMIKTGEL